MTKTTQIECGADLNNSLDTIRRMYDQFIYMKITRDNAQTLSDAINFLEIYEEEIKLMRRNMEMKYNRWIMDSFSKNQLVRES